MKVLLGTGRSEIIEKKSRFLGLAVSVRTPEEAGEVMSDVRKEHHDARHHCYAYVLGENGQTSRCSDDGEPSGTGGRPILGLLASAGVTDALVVVTRYFGGVLLGTGGLSRAYRDAASDALADAGMSEILSGMRCTLSPSYPLLARVQQVLDASGVLTLDTRYAEDVILSLLVPEKEAAALDRQLADATAGVCRLSEGEPCRYLADEAGCVRLL